MIVAGPTAAAESDAQVLDRLAAGALAQDDHPGLAIAFVRTGRPAIVRGYGVRSLATRAPVDADTRFGLGSCSKSFGAATVARLVERGALGWEDRVQDRLPWFRARDPWITRELTLTDILTDRSGLAAAMPRAAAASPREFLESVANAEPVRPFRSGYAYANDMFTLAGEVVRTQAGAARWADVARDELWTPLGMSRTNADAREAAADPDAASPHRRIDGRLQPIPWVYEDDVAPPSGGVNSTAADMARWLALQLAAPQVPALLTPAALARMHAPQTPLGAARSAFGWAMPPGPDGPRFEAYGMGWFVHDYRGVQVAYHDGSIAGFRCFMGLLPERGLGLAVLSNSEDGLLGEGLFQALLDRELGLPDSDWPRRFHEAQLGREARAAAFAAELEATRAPSLPPSLSLSAYAGSYVDLGGMGRAEVRREGEALTLRLGRLTWALEPWRADLFRLRLRWPYPWGEPSFARFEVGPTGQVAAVTIDARRLARSGP